MDPYNFAVTGLSRSGTTWLARELGRSKTFEVHHETMSDRKHPKSRETWQTMIDRFKVPRNYGEVNNFLRFVLMDLNVKKRAIIIRDPRAIMLSSVNAMPKRHKNEAFENICRDVQGSLWLLFGYIKAGIPTWKFEDITNQKKLGPTLLFMHLEVDDIQVTSMEPANKPTRRFGEKWTDLDEWHRDCMNSHFKFFIEEFYPA